MPGESPFNRKGKVPEMTNASGTAMSRVRFGGGASVTNPMMIPFPVSRGEPIASIQFLSLTSNAMHGTFMSPPEGVVPLREAMQRLGVSRQTIRQRAASGQIESPHAKRGAVREPYVRLEADRLPLFVGALPDREQNDGCIDNLLHRVPGISMNEDRLSSRTGNGTENHAVMRRLALNPAGATPDPHTKSMRASRKGQAGMTVAS